MVISEGVERVVDSALCVAKCGQIKQNMVNLEASTSSEVSCQVTASTHRGFIMTFTVACSLAHPFMFNTHS